MSDGWGGGLAAVVGDALDALPAFGRVPVGTGLEVAGEFSVRAAGAELDSPPDGDPTNVLSSLAIVRESAQVDVCVSESEDQAPLSLYPAIQAAVIAVQTTGEWRDPQVDFIEPSYPERSERGLPVAAGFLISARVQGWPT